MGMMRSVFAALIALTAAFGGVAKGTIRPASIFSDNMVIQADKPVRIWGSSDTQAVIEVSLIAEGRVEASAKASTVGGKWRVELPAMKSSFLPRTVSITGGTDTAVINNVLIGEVWLAAGQSNMQFPLMNAIGAIPLIQEAAGLSSIRIFFQASAKPSAIPLDDVYEGKWSVNSSNSAKWSSAVGYSFARKLYEYLNVPIGLVHTPQGGTNIQVWMAREIFETYPELKRDFPAEDYDWQQQDSWQKDTGLFNSKIYPLAGFPLRGVLWYQGENNASLPSQYRQLFKLMAEDWRKRWDTGSMSFLYVQLAAYENEDWRQFRLVQLECLKDVSNSAMVVTADLPLDYGLDIAGFYGTPHPIHPATKLPVGERLAKAAMAVTYRRKIEYSGPMAFAVDIVGSRLFVRFLHTGKGLVFSPKQGVSGFEVAGADGVYHPAIAAIKDCRIILYSENVFSPVKARYGWDKVPAMTLFNLDGLPASPFVIESEIQN